MLSYYSIDIKLLISINSIYNSLLIIKILIFIAIINSLVINGKLFITNYFFISLSKYNL